MPHDLPTWALSVRQPWAWAIIHGEKDVENRSEAACRHGLSKAVGQRIAIHASSGMTWADYHQASVFMASIGVQCPPAYRLDRRGIIGSVDVVDVVRSHPSQWFFGPVGLVLCNPQPVEFVPANGFLGLFEWLPGSQADLPKLAKWMMPDQIEMFDGPEGKSDA